MKITLISPSPHIPTMIGYGTRILASCLKREGWESQLIFLPRNVGDLYEEGTLRDVVALCRDSDLVGVSLMTDDFRSVVPLTRAYGVHWRRGGGAR